MAPNTPVLLFARLHAYCKRSQLVGAIKNEKKTIFACCVRSAFN